MRGVCAHKCAVQAHLFCCKEYLSPQLFPACALACPQQQPPLARSTLLPCSSLHASVWAVTYSSLWRLLRCCALPPAGAGRRAEGT